MKIMEPFPSDYGNKMFVFLATLAAGAIGAVAGLIIQMVLLFDSNASANTKMIDVGIAIFIFTIGIIGLFAVAADEKLPWKITIGIAACFYSTMWLMTESSVIYKLWLSLTGYKTDEVFTTLIVCGLVFFPLAVLLFKYTPKDYENNDDDDGEWMGDETEDDQSVAS